uniref:AnkA n=1 Tax=Anaplasma phagocytophilum TaxID=948 RepID=R9WY22_ANAPH|nr:AnkA [Anaplasma phagocytophilum]
MLTEEERTKIKGVLQAIIQSDYGKFERLLQGVSTEGINTAVDANGRTLVHYAATSREEKYYNILVERGAVTNIRDANGIDPQQAREQARRARTQWVGADINDPGVARQCMMQAAKQAAKRKFYESIAILDLVQNCDVNMQLDEVGNSVLHLACLEGSEPSFTSALLMKGSSLSAQDVDGNTPIHAAAASGAKHAVDNLSVLCDHALIADINARRNDGNTALHVAVSFMSKPKIEHLLTRLSNIGLANNEGESICGIVAKMWPRREILPFVEKVTQAVSPNIEGNRECADSLLLPDKTGTSAVLHIMKRQVQEAPKVFQTALNIADMVYASGAPEVKSLFVCPNTQDAKTLMHFVCSKNMAHCGSFAFSVLDEAHHRYGDAPFSVVDTAGKAPVHIAAEESSIEVFKKVVLCTSEEVINAVASNGRAPIHMLVEDEVHPKAASEKLYVLLENARNLPSINLPSPVSGCTPVVTAYKKGCFEEVERMLRHYSMVVEAPSHDGLTVLHHAARDGNLEILTSAVTAWNLKHGSYSNFPVRDEVPTPGVYAVREAKDLKALVDVIDRLLEHEPNPQHIAIEAIRRGASGLLEHFITQGVVDVNEKIVNLEGGETTLMLEALRAGQYDLVKILIDSGATVEGISTEPALSAGILGGCFQGRNAIRHMARVVDAGAMVNAPVGALSPLTAAVQAANKGVSAERTRAVIKFLAQRGADLDSTDEIGNPALHLATANGDKKTAKVLMESGANPKQQDGNGRTALHIAAAKGDIVLFKLIAKQCQESCFSAHSYIGDTALQEVLCNPSTSEKCCLKMLKELKKRVSKECFKDIINTRQLANGATLLHMAAERGFGKACSLLLEAGAEVSVADIEGRTPADVASPALKVRPWFFGKSVARKLMESVQVPEGGFPPYVPSEAMLAGYRTPTWESISTVSSISSLSSFGSKSESDLVSEARAGGAVEEVRDLPGGAGGIESVYATAGAGGSVESESIYEEVGDLPGSAGGIESIYATVGAGGSVESESIYEEVGDLTTGTGGAESIYATAGARGVVESESIYEEVGDLTTGTGGAESIYATAGARGVVESESIYEEVGDLTTGTGGAESIYATVGARGAGVRPEPERPESIYAEADTSPGKGTATPEPIYATVKKGVKKGDTSQREEVPVTSRKTISVVKKKDRPAAPPRTSSLPPADLSSDRSPSVTKSSSCAGALQEQKSKSSPGQAGATVLTSEAEAALASTGVAREELARAAEGLQGAVEAQKGEGAEKASSHSEGPSSDAPGRAGDGSQPEAPQSEGHKYAKRGGRGR